MKIVADENIARAAEAFAQFGEVRLMAGRDIAKKDLIDADALIVRSITRVNRKLLEGTRVGFVGTATIGTDHIDFHYLDERGIAFADAAGGGARSVAEYAASGLLLLHQREIVNLATARLAVLGVGAIGQKVAAFGRTLGMDVIEYDPPRAASEPEFTSSSLEDVFQSDILSLSVPLTTDGEHPTRRLVDRSFLEAMKPQSILINTARGGVVDSGELRRGLLEGKISGAVLDVWEEEPEVPVDLLEHCLIATPHIAGYSQDGKLKGTEMMADGLARFAGMENRWRTEHALPETAGRVDLRGLERFEAFAKGVHTAYDISEDDRRLRELFSLPPEERRAGFDRLRKTYRARREFPAWKVVTDDEAIRQGLKNLGFATADGTA